MPLQTPPGFIPDPVQPEGFTPDQALPKEPANTQAVGGDTINGRDPNASPGIVSRVSSMLDPLAHPKSLMDFVSLGGLTSAPLAQNAIPAVTNAIPTTTKAGAKFQEVMGAAKNIPIDVNAPGQVALRINELAEHGGSMPMVVRKFLNYVTDPQKPPMTYEVARDFASNVSRLSADEMGRLTPVVGREVANLRVALNKAVGDAASAAGKGQEYAQAMTEYARAMKLRGFFDSVLEGAKKGAPYATAAGMGQYFYSKLRDLLSD